MNQFFPRKEIPKGFDIMNPITSKTVVSNDCYGNFYSALARECQLCAVSAFCSAQYTQNIILKKKAEVEKSLSPDLLKTYDIPQDINDKLVLRIKQFSENNPITYRELFYYLAEKVFLFTNLSNLDDFQTEKLERNIDLFIELNKNSIYYNKELKTFRAL